MCFISTFIDLNKGILFVESPRCQVKLPINFITDSCNGGSEQIKLNGQRQDNICVSVFLTACYSFGLECHGLVRLVGLMECLDTITMIIYLLICRCFEVI